MTLKKTILVLEDDADYRRLLTTKLTDAGYKVLAAADATEAMKHVINNPLDLILLDLVLPGADGVDFFYRASMLKKKIPVIILSNLSRSAYPSDISDYLVKASTSLEQVVAKVKEYIG